MVYQKKKNDYQAMRNKKKKGKLIAQSLLWNSFMNIKNILNAGSHL